MKRILQLISWTALAGIFISAMMHYRGQLAPGTMETTILLCTAIWFVATPLWMGRKRES